MFDQLDVNLPVSSGMSSLNDSFEFDSQPLHISVQIGHNKILQAVSLPKLSSYNMRSLMPKIRNFGTDMEERMCSLSFLSEIWQKAENKKHKYKIEELFELRGMKYISTPRPGNRRGGGGCHCCQY